MALRLLLFLYLLYESCELRFPQDLACPFPMGGLGVSRYGSHCFWELCVCELVGTCLRSQKW